MEVIFQIRVDRASLKNVENVLGYKIASKYETRLVQATNKLAQEALKALKSKVPVHTAELRNNFLAINYATGKNPTATVGVDPGTHHGFDEQPIDVFELAFEKLDKGHGKRSSNSYAIPPYSSIPYDSPTRGWVTSAVKAFNSRRRGILSGS